MSRTAEMLEDMDWQTVVAASRMDAFHSCLSRRPNLIIVDIEMQDGIGLKAISMLRRTNERLFILAVTRGSHDDKLLEVAKTCGADRQMIGPVSAPKLSAAIEAGRRDGLLHIGRYSS
jgi:DNA-binding response OmpR family regulator